MVEQKAETREKTSVSTILTILLVGILIIAALFLILQGKFIYVAWLAGSVWCLYCVVLGIRLCFDIHAIRLMLEYKEDK